MVCCCRCCCTSPTLPLPVSPFLCLPLSLYILLFFLPLNLPSFILLLYTSWSGFLLCDAVVGLLFMTAAAINMSHVYVRDSSFSIILQRIILWFIWKRKTTQEKGLFAAALTYWFLLGIIGIYWFYLWCPKNIFSHISCLSSHRLA